ncbi:MAG: substrate-binding domain-containing protein [Oscillospiraceae bacterium]|nr:substrate-binding domain-containing protein [Oscillospiraceae bacterium]
MNNRLLKIIAAIAIMVYILSACSNPNGNPPKQSGASEQAISAEQPLMTAEEYPLTQGSNPTRIISEKLFARFTGLDDTREDYYRIKHTGTSAAYAEFLTENSGIDMIIAQQPDPKTEQELENTHFKEIAKDALVFITNAGNPVDNLTTPQLMGILTGKIKNWTDVGGNDEPISLFARNETGGSQILLKKYILKNTDMVEVPEKNYANDMNVMSRYVAENTQNGATLGYTTYYFAEFSGKREDIKIIRINGIKAEFNTIEQNLYPFVAFIYAGVKNMDSPAGAIFQWLSTPDGKELIKTTGYIPY